MAVSLEMQGGAKGVRHVPGGVCAPSGFLASGVHTGVKRKRRDLALLFSDVPAHAVATFTTNRVKAAPLLLTMEHLQRSGGLLQALVVNSGNANSCNGPQGMDDARTMAQLTASSLGIPVEWVAVGSTGVIGLPLDMEKLVPGIPEAVRGLHANGSVEAVEGIMTTDTQPKEVAVECLIGGLPVRIGGIAKGSGMIHPNMATMFAFVTTDAAVAPDVLVAAHRKSVAKSYNMISVDGDTSTNDMAVLLANGRAGNSLIAGGSHLDAFQEALDYVNIALAKAIVRDGEGATKLIEIHVKGAPGEEDARKIARSIAGSNLVKTAVFGCDPNWGRIFCAAGYSGAEFDPEKVDIFLGPIQVAKNGVAIPFDDEKARRFLDSTDVSVTLDFQMGSGEATAWCCDMTYDYVKINASYRS